MKRIIVALDFKSSNSALSFVRTYLDPSKHAVKIGTDFLLDADAFSILRELGFDIMLDCKFHDTPDTVYRYAETAHTANVRMFTVHASGLKKMLECAVRGAGGQTLVMAITILTSTEEKDLCETYGISNKHDLQLKLEEIAIESGCDGVVAPGSQIERFKKEYPDNLILTPGIRGHGDDKHCQQDVITPQEAIDRGVDFMVFGRYLTETKDPRTRLTEIERMVIDNERNR